MTRSAGLAPLLERFFVQRLMNQRQASPHTVKSYRDAFCQLLPFAWKRLGRQPSDLQFEQIDAPLVVDFLDDLEATRGVSVRSRNLRLAAVHSFFRFAAFELPTHADQIQRVLAIPPKRCTRRQVGFLARDEVDALLAAPDRSTWSGRRDHAFILTAVQTGFRLSEMTGLTRDDFAEGGGRHLRVVGKGRKERCTPLAKPTRDVQEVAAGAATWIGRRALSQRQGQPARRGRRPVPAEQASGHGREAVPVTGRQAGDRTCPSPHRGDGSHAGRRPPVGDRSLARARAGRNHPDLCRGDARHEGAGTRDDDAAKGRSGTVPAARQSPRLPAQPLKGTGLCRAKRAQVA